MKFKEILLILGLVILTSFSSFSGYFILAGVHTEDEIFNVTRVIDGDTIDLSNGETVRLLGINAPDKGEYYYHDAKDSLAQLIQGKHVRLESGPEDRDKYNRSLRYVFLDDTLINVEMIKQGNANTFILNEDDEHYLDLMKAQKYAKDSKLGIWNVANMTSCMIISNFHYDAAGNDDKNLNDEYVSFTNTCDVAVNLNGWVVRDSGRTKYTFGKLSIKSNDTLSLFSGDGKDTSSNLYWKNKKSVWTNSGDILFLWDGNGNLVLSRSYP